METKTLLCSHCNKFFPIEKISTCVDKGKMVYECTKPCKSDKELYNDEHKRISNLLLSLIKETDKKIVDIKNGKMSEDIMVEASDIEQIIVGGMCYLTLPCLHNLEIITLNYSLSIKSVPAPTIYTILKKLLVIGKLDKDYLNKEIKHFDYMFKHDFVVKQVDKIKDNKTIVIKGDNKILGESNFIYIVFNTEEEKLTIEEKYKIKKEKEETIEREKIDSISKYEYSLYLYETLLAKLENLKGKEDPKYMDDLNEIRSMINDEINKKMMR